MVDRAERPSLLLNTGNRRRENDSLFPLDMPLSNILTSATQKGEKVLFLNWEVSYVMRYKNTVVIV
jgi:hypothetical protein